MTNYEIKRDAHGAAQAIVTTGSASASKWLCVFPDWMSFADREKNAETVMQALTANQPAK